MRNFEKDKRDLINKGYLIKKVESKKSLKYISDFLKKKLINEINIKKSQQFSFNNLHKYIEINQLNSIRLKLIKYINQNSLFRKNLFFLAKQNLYEMVGNELAMQRKINLSIQLSGDNSSLLPIHSDVWSGCSPYEIVLWVPLVDVKGSKSMFIFPKLY